MISCTSNEEANLKRIHHSEAGFSFFEVVNFDNIKQVKVRNIQGPHLLKEADWAEIKAYLRETKSVNGLLCKPKNLALIFEFTDGETISASICGKHLNFEEKEIIGSFQLPKEINFHNY